MQQAVTYLTNMGRAEKDLREVYINALESIAQAIGPAGATARTTSSDSGSEIRSPRRRPGRLLRPDR
jgi:hypothetical protein